MAKKDDTIMKKLSDLKPSVPTKTRKKSLNASERKSSLVVKEHSPGVVELMTENVSAMEEIRNTLLGEAGKIHSVILDSWKKTMFISYDLQRTNLSYIMKVIRSFIPIQSDNKSG